MSLRDKLCDLFADGTELVLMRHGNTNKRIEDSEKSRTEIDFARTLSSTGKDQSGSAHDGYFKKLPKVKRIFSSPPSRTMNTASIITGLPNDCIEILQSGYPDSPLHDVKASEDAFDKLGYGSINQFFSESPEVEKSLRKYAETVLTDMLNSFSIIPKTPLEGTAIYFCGHAMYTNTMALVVAEALQYSDDDISKIRSTVLSEATSFYLTKEGYSYHCP